MHCRAGPLDALLGGVAGDGDRALWQSAGVALDDREAVVDEAVSKSFSAGRIVLEVVPAAGSDGFAGSHAGTPARLIVRAARRDPGAFALAGGRKSDGAAGKQAGAPVF